MKKHLFTILLLPLSLFSAHAQEASRSNRTPEQIAEKQTERLQRDLELTDAQRDSIYLIHLRYARLRRPTDTQDTIRHRISLLRDEIKRTLTPEQCKHLADKQEEGPRRKPAQRVVSVQVEVADSLTATPLQEE